MASQKTELIKKRNKILDSIWYNLGFKIDQALNEIELKEYQERNLILEKKLKKIKNFHKNIE